MSESAAVWSERGTTPAKIDAALRELLKERRAHGERYAPARVLNLVVVADRDWQGEILNRLEGVGRYHASRTIVCAVEDGRDEIDAWASMEAEEDDIVAGRLAVAHEDVVLELGTQHLEHLDRIVDPLVVTDLPTVVWSPHGHPEAVDALLGLAQVVLIDSVTEPSARGALDRAASLAEQAYVVDLAWLRSTPWRERVASTFDPPQWRPELACISGFTVRYCPDSEAAAALLVGWLGNRLGWTPGPLTGEPGSLHGTARGDDGDIAISLEADPSMPIPGLSGVTVETRSGLMLTLDRGAGGLRARRTTTEGEQSWTVLGASRGEAGILGEGIRQALLRDKGYGPALAAAREMICQ